MDEEQHVEIEAPPEAPSREEALTAAFEAAMSEEAPQEAPESPSAPPAEESPGEPAAEPAARSERARDAQGRFARAGEPAAPEAPAGEAPAGEQPEAEPGADSRPEPIARAPQSWRPEVREHWADLPPEVQHEVARREQQINDTLRTTEVSRRLGEGLMQAAQPYVEQMRAAGTDPVGAAAHLFRAASVLQRGTPQQKAQQVAAIIRDNGIDIGLLDQTLDVALQGAAATPAPTPQDIEALVEQRLAARDAQYRQRAHQQTAHEASRHVYEEWGADKEFLSDVRHTMADLMERARTNGSTITLDQAYTRACQLDAGISRILEQRQRAAEAKAAAASREAASSVRGSPTGAPPRANGPLSREEALSQAWDLHSGT